jgi:kynurenine formamidase
MCAPLCLHRIQEHLSRRAFLGATVMAGTGATAAAEKPPPASATRLSFQRVIDLTHTLVPDFPTWGGKKQLEIETVARLAKDGFNFNTWRVMEHTGTHLDAPFHASDGPTADLIPAADLVGPLAVVDIRAKAAQNPDAQLTLDDLRGWEARHGPIPAGGVVAMLSGWDARAGDAGFRNTDATGKMHFPGFHLEAAQFLLAQRSVKGLVVDTLSLDHGPTTDFPVHFHWLPANRWGLECAANLGALPARGATIVVGGPKVKGASGGPSRVFALV